MQISLKAEQIGQIFGFPITNTLLMSWIAMLVIGVFFLFGVKRLNKVPTGVQNFLEALYEGFLSFMDLVTGKRAHSEKFFPLVFTFFIFILTSNWLGILPGLGSIGFYELHEGAQTFVPFARSANSDLNMTLALAVVSVVATHFYGAKTLGSLKHSSKYISLKGPIQFFVGILELVSEFAKILSFSFRLFGNIFAGEVLLIIMGILLPFVAPIPFLGLELFVGLIQALIFATLTLVFLEVAVSEQH
ncbi:MAG: F0F1 ATP synthase subunit A [Candidatus Portnoybacteria bacterium]|nr:F0F1 ATP synthase subunit A [Candidatus Portnoybacteria bacterium]